MHTALGTRQKLHDRRVMGRMVRWTCLRKGVFRKKSIFEQALSSLIFLPKDEQKYHEQKNEQFHCEVYL